MTLGLDCCCPNKPCTLFKDDFNRTSLGNSYTATNATITSGRLTSAALGPYSAICLFTTPDVKMVVDANLSFTNGSLFTERAGIIVNYKDANNYLFVEIEATFSTFAGTVRTRLFFYRRSGGVTTQLGTTKTLDATKGVVNHALRVCYDGEKLKAYGYSEAATPIEGGHRAGMYSSSSSSSVFFDNFKIIKHAIGCPNCATKFVCGDCNTGDLPKTEFILDLGSGGLTNSIWNQAAFLSGEFILRVLEFDPFFGGWPMQCIPNQFMVCNYFYNQYPAPGTLTYPSPCGVGGSLAVNMLLSQYVDRFTFAPAVRTGWQVLIGACDPLVGCGTSFLYGATYRGTYTPYGDCDQTPITLTREGQVIQTVRGSPFVGGSLPSTIELKVPA